MADTAQDNPVDTQDAPDVATDADTEVQRQSQPAQVDVDWLAGDLLGRWAERRLAVRAIAADPAYQRIPDQSMAEHRARVSDQIRALARAGTVTRAFPTRLGGANDHGGNIAGFEELVLADPSLQIKSGVQFGLFGAAVLHLGTDAHRDAFLPGIMSLAVPGAFAMTEIGHGSDVASLETTATYDPSAEEFVIHTPGRSAWKEYIGNAARDGIAAVVFAQLITADEGRGVHAFYVPLRDAAGNFLPGISGEDDGVKGGLNGVDNGRLCFDNVRIPRGNLLNRYGDVAPDGTYQSPIKNPGRRFFTMLGTLVQGRVSLSGAGVVASKAALAIAIRYGAERRQFPGPTGAEELILDYRRHQRRLFIRLADVYARAYAQERLLHDLERVFSGAADTPEAREDLETLAAGLKALSTWNALDTLQECREACGGAGFLAANRFTMLRQDLDVYVTFEGDNTVLLQLVGKRLLADFAKQLKGAGAAALAQFAAREFAGRAAALVGFQQLSQDVGDLWRASSASVALRKPEVQRQLMNDRVETMIAEIAGRLREVGRDDKTKAAAAFNNEQNELITTARAWVELQQYDALAGAVERAPEGTREVLAHLRDLFALSLIERDAAWYLANGRLSGARAKVVTSTLERLLVKIRPHALDLVAAFGYDNDHLRAAIVNPDLAPDAQPTRPAR